MRIAFDAKRAFQNQTGLGHYSRTLIASLAEGFPEHEYFLMAPKATTLFQPAQSNVKTITPQGIAKSFRSLWRSNWVKKDLKHLKVELYHGLSHEIPVGIQHTDTRSVVTMHDLIFERYPKQYSALDVAIYRKKFRYACMHADKVIAISEQTKQDLIEFYKTPADKINVCYQSSNPIFEKIVSDVEKERIRNKYGLPQQYFLYVGSIIERKNLLTICKALHQLRGKLDIPLIIIGTGNNAYAQKVKSYVAEHNLPVIFLSDNATINNDNDFKSSADFPAIYQSAVAMIYPSIFEGFGLPVLEALWSGTPVITSNVSCMPETGGNAAYYVSPFNTEEMATAMFEIASNADLRKSMADKGIIHAQKFAPHRCAEKVMEVYNIVMP